MTALPLFARHFRDMDLTGAGVVSVSPDAGRARLAVRFAEMIDAEFAIIHKTRPAHEEVSVTAIAGRVRDKTASSATTSSMTGGTPLANVAPAQKAGAKDVWVFATHGQFCDDALERFSKTDITGIIVTDTVPIDPRRAPYWNLTVLTVSGLLAETIMNVFADDSVSAIFGGENQLF